MVVLGKRSWMRRSDRPPGAVTAGQLQACTLGIYFFFLDAPLGSLGQLSSGFLGKRNL